MFGFYLCFAVSMASIWFSSVLFDVDLFYLVLTSTDRLRYVLFSFDPLCSESMCFIPFLSVLFDIDLFHLVSISTVLFFCICSIRFVSVLFRFICTVRF